MRAKVVFETDVAGGLQGRGRPLERRADLDDPAPDRPGQCCACPLAGCSLFTPTENTSSILLYFKNRNVIVLRPRKVASTSFEIAMSKFAEKDDVLTPIAEEHIRQDLGFRTAQNYTKAIWEYSVLDPLRVLKNKEPVRKWIGHESAAGIEAKIGAERFAQAFKIAIVRNPYDVVKSLYYFEQQQAALRYGKPGIGLEAWAEQNPKKLCCNAEQYFIRGTYCLDFALRYEDIERDMRHLETIRPDLGGVTDVFLNVGAKSGITPKTSRQEMFAGADALVARIGHANKDLMDRFGYTFEA